MSLQRIPTIILCALLLILAATEVRAQQPVDSHSHRIMHDIDKAYRDGRINLDQKILYKFYAGLKKEKLPSEFTIGDQEYVKCGTPAQVDFIKHKNQLSESTVTEIETLTGTSVTQAQETYLSPSGMFLFHYETSGTDAVPLDDTSPANGIPDYVEQAGIAADSSWRHQIATLNYSDPIIPGDPYDIYFRNFGFYGQTAISGNTTYIEVHNNFQNFPPNTDPEGNPIGALKVTIAHELKHAIQYVATEWAGESDRWVEMDATLMEEVVYDNVNDYYNYLNNSSSIFENPQNSFYPGSYFHVSWALYFEEKYGPDFWPQVWDRLQQNPTGTRFTEAIQSVLGSADIFQRDYIESHLWHLAAGQLNSVDNYGFEERTLYPNPTIKERFSGKDSTTTSVGLQKFAANYIELSPGQESEGFIRVELSRSNASTGLGLIAYLKDGSTEQQIMTGGGNQGIVQQTPWEWSSISRLGIVIGNGNENLGDSYRLKVTSDIPEAISLIQNYPNPFNPGTVIPFNLSTQSRVQLKVYDITGRLVSTLVDEERPAGFYRDVRFNGSNLASGVYFYQLVTDQKVLVKKMTLIK
ncbi:T9SS type A sorting domain-containing protein [Balneolaceae bacterium YR4-1]|uniref:T9SS type A sorting domain-containing protein n=1 Tax=Halalkalibaculum roseum TaxID=2709311 RepID=A0A6M1T4E7_9BACT|nr:T9SS type A sorting domain-containing protein [Halalkalibaculum roseum]NGP77637.1 T9SS type A sorting domain-containing protein [Halalkalibaculum roseum]